MKIAFLGNFVVDYTSESHHAKTLESMGHEVLRAQEGGASQQRIAEVAGQADLFVWVHTHGWDAPGMASVLSDLRLRGIPSVTYHLDLWMGLARQRDMMGSPYWNLDHFFTVDQLMADWLNANTPVTGHYLPAGVFGQECEMVEPDKPFDVAFVGSRQYHPEWPYREKLVAWLHETYGRQFRHFGPDGPWGAARGSVLNQVYADARVVVCDSLCPSFDYPDYWSDRVYETMGRGGFAVHPKVKGMPKSFIDGQHLVYYDYGDFGQLKHIIDHFLLPDSQEQRERIRLAGHQLVKSSHTYRQRWETILETVCR